MGQTNWYSQTATLFLMNHQSAGRHMRPHDTPSPPRLWSFFVGNPSTSCCHARHGRPTPSARAMVARHIQRFGGARARSPGGHGAAITFGKKWENQGFLGKTFENSRGFSSNHLGSMHLLVLHLLCFFLPRCCEVSV